MFIKGTPDNWYGTDTTNQLGSTIGKALVVREAVIVSKQSLLQAIEKLWNNIMILVTSYLSNKIPKSCDTPH